jgi:peptide/nickel transport system substrate-binding protein
VVVWLVSSTALVSLLATCAPAQAPPGAAPARSAPPQATGQNPGPAGQPAAPASAPSSGSAEWVVALAEEAATLDPLYGQSTAGSTLAQSHIFDPLVGYEGANLKQVPMLAESWKLLDERTWEFQLRKGVKFHNGDDFTAGDVTYSFEAYKSGKSPRGIYAEEITGVEAVDPYTVRFTTRGPNPSLPANLASLYIVPRAAREQAGDEAFAAQPIGSGPYKLVEFVRGQRLSLEANPSYWQGRVSPPKLTLRPIGDPTTRVAELRTGGVQVVEAPPVAQLAELEGGNTEPVVIKGARLIMHAFNTTKPPFNDVRMRQAVNYAVDREAIVKSVLEGHGELLHGSFSSAWMGYDPSIQPYAYDPAKAKQLLAEAGYPNGLETTFNHSTGALLKDREIAEVVASQLAAVGIRVQLIPTERAKLQSDWLNGSYEGFTSVVWGTAADPDPMLGWTFYKRKGHQPDDQLNGLIEQSRRTLDPEQRKRILQDFSRYVHDQAYWLFIHAQDDFYAKQKDVPWEIWPASSTIQIQRYYRVSGR